MRPAKKQNMSLINVPNMPAANTHSGRNNSPRAAMPAASIVASPSNTVPTTMAM
jgi:hypothetical protein